MPQYVCDALTQFLHKLPTKPQHAPHHWSKPIYSKTQEPTQLQQGLQLNINDTKIIQQILRTFFYYGRGVDYTILPTLNEISTQQSKPFDKTQQKCNMLIDYLATCPDATLRFYASNMQLHIETDAAYLVLPKAKSSTAAFFYLRDNTTTTKKKSRINGAIHVSCKTIPNVVSSASKAETGNIYLDAKEAVPIIIALEEMGHLQNPNSVPITTDNITAHGILTNDMQAKLSKAYDMRYH